MIILIRASLQHKMSRIFFYEVFPKLHAVVVFRKYLISLIQGVGYVYGRKKGPGIRMQGILKYLLRVPKLYQPSAKHDPCTVTDISYHGKIMGDKQK